MPKADPKICHRMWPTSPMLLRRTNDRQQDVGDSHDRQDDFGDFRNPRMPPKSTGAQMTIRTSAV